MTKQLTKSLTVEEQQIYVQGWEAGYEFAKSKFTAEEQTDSTQLNFEDMYEQD